MFSTWIFPITKDVEHIFMFTDHLHILFHTSVHIIKPFFKKKNWVNFFLIELQEIFTHSGYEFAVWFIYIKYLTIFIVEKKEKSFSHVRLFVTSQTVAYQAPPSMGFSRQAYWSGLPLPSPNKSSYT